MAASVDRVTRLATKAMRWHRNASVGQSLLCVYDLPLLESMLLSAQDAASKLAVIGLLVLMWFRFRSKAMQEGASVFKGYQIEPGGEANQSWISVLARRIHTVIDCRNQT